MYLAYLDDSDTKAKKRKLQVVAGVIIDDEAFKMTRIRMSAVSEVLMGEENLEKFEEFHACELYGGHKAFEGISQESRFGAINYLLSLLDKMNITVVYGVVDLEELQTNIYGSADPVDVCFRQSLDSIEKWAETLVQDRLASVELTGDQNKDVETVKPILMEGFIQSLIILIVDECDGKTKHTLQQSFRNLRKRDKETGCFHDDMYFGDSRYSIGIQLADLCAYFIARHLEGDEEIEPFYQKIEPRLYPKQLKNLKALMELPKELPNDTQKSGIPGVREGDENKS